MSSYRNYETIAKHAHLEFSAAHPAGTVWHAVEDHPYVSPFVYDVSVQGDDDDLTLVGRVDGYRIVHNWAVQNDVEIWDQADAVDQDVVNYVDAAVRELRALDAAGICEWHLHMARHITLVKHVFGVDGPASPQLWRDCVASLLLMDAPGFIMVDPNEPSGGRDASARIRGRGRIHELLSLGLSRMVVAHLVWGWDLETGDVGMAGYDYSTLLAARGRPEVAAALATPVYPEVHGELPPDVAEAAGFPMPGDLDE